MLRRSPCSTLFPYTTLVRSGIDPARAAIDVFDRDLGFAIRPKVRKRPDRKSTRLNSSHQIISYAVFCLKKKRTVEKVLPHVGLDAVARGLLQLACLVPLVRV